MDAPTDLARLGRIGFIGAGAAGSTLARALAAKGAHVTAVASRRPQRAEAVVELLPEGAQALPPEDIPDAADLIILAVADDAISSLADRLPWRRDQVVAHLSGARPADALAAVRERGALPAALHPLLTFPMALLEQPAEALVRRLQGCYWTLDAGDARAGAALETLVAGLDGRLLRLRGEDRVPYHIAAVFASNYVVALLGGSARLWETFGMAPEEAVRALLPLLRAAVESLATAGLPGALTGPLARGDAGTIAAHLAWLDTHAGEGGIAEVRDAYLALARLALPLVEAQGGVSPAVVEELRAAVDRR